MQSVALSQKWHTEISGLFLVPSSQAQIFAQTPTRAEDAPLGMISRAAEKQEELTRRGSQRRKPTTYGL